MPRFFWFRFRMLFELTGFGLFLFGFFSHNPLLTNVGGVILIGWDVISILTGVLKPGFPIIAALLISPWFTPWWYGTYWVSAAFSVIDIPFYIVWMFKPPMAQADDELDESLDFIDDTASISQHDLPPTVRPLTRRLEEFGPYVMGAVVIAGALGLYFVMANNFRQPKTQIDISEQKVPTPEETQLVWRTGSFANHTVSIDYPDGAIVDSDNPGLIEINEKLQGFALIWSDNVTGRDISNLIDTVPTDPDFAGRYVEFTRKNLLKGVDDPEARIVSIDEPVIGYVGQYATIIVNVVIYIPSQLGHETTRVMIVAFDCDTHVCQAQYYKDGGNPFTDAQWDQASHMIASISFME